LTVDDATALTPALVTSVDAMARRALRDELPGILLRGAIRSTAKAVAQYQARRAAQKKYQKGDDGTAAALELTAFMLMIGSALTESADERGWRSLPAQVYVARARLPPGRHRVRIDTSAGPHITEVNISGSHAFVALRLLRGTLFALLPQAPAIGGPAGPVPEVEAASGAEQVAPPANGEEHSR
jgi:hypothetical protein